MIRKTAYIFLFLLLLGGYFHANTQQPPPAPPPLPPPLIYTCTIDNRDQVYDGDTISDVLIHVADIEVEEDLGEVFPGVIVKNDGIYVRNDVRIAGVDTPEMRTSARKRDGTRRSDQSRANEKKAARLARDAVAMHLANNNLQFEISTVELDKYGRVLANVRVGTIDLGEYLINNRHAIKYDGGRKQELDWDRLDQGYVR